MGTGGPVHLGSSVQPSAAGEPPCPSLPFTAQCSLLRTPKFLLGICAPAAAAAGEGRAFPALSWQLPDSASVSSVQQEA